jgi:hypothetical protein
MSKKKIKKELKAASKDVRAAERRLTKDTNLNVRQRRNKKWRRKPRNNNNKRRKARNDGGSRVARLADVPTDVKTYIEAVTDPFSPRGLGALIPDATTFDRTSATDRILFTFEPDKFASTSASSPYNSTDDLAGVLITLFPRSFSSGFGTALSRVSTTATAYELQVPYSYFQDGELVYGNTSTSVTPSDANGINHACLVCIIPINTDGDACRIPSYEEQNTIGGFVAGTLMKGPSFIKMDREDAIFDNVIDTRIVGGGLKVNTISAQLYTGGITITGYIPCEALYYALRGNARNSQPMDVPKLFTDRKMRTGYQGTTIRMRTTQVDAKSRTFQPHVLDSTYWGYTNGDDEYDITNRSYADGEPSPYKPTRKRYRAKNIKNKLGELIEEKEECIPKYKDKYNKTIINKNVTSASNVVTQIIYPDWGADLATYDFVSLGHKLPAVYYSFNVDDPNGNPNLNIQSIVHYECHTRPTCPFQATPTQRFRDIVDLQALLDQPEHAPYYASGNSLKSIMGKIGRIAKRVPKFLSKAAAVSAVIAEVL